MCRECPNLMCGIHFVCNFGETILGGAYNATKIKIFKNLIQKGKFRKKIPLQMTIRKSLQTTAL